MKFKGCVCKHCGCDDFYLKSGYKNENQYGMFCSKCDKYHKFANEDERFFWNIAKKVQEAKPEFENVYEAAYHSCLANLNQTAYQLREKAEYLVEKMKEATAEKDIDKTCFYAYEHEKTKGKIEMAASIYDFLRSKVDGDYASDSEREDSDED